MGYERNDRRYGSYQGGGQGRDDQDRYRFSSSGRSGDYGSYGGSGARDYRGDRYNDRGYGSQDRDNERGFFDRAGDEVRSWFGDEEAERRRRQDDRERGYDQGRSYYGNDYGRSGSDYARQSTSNYGGDRSSGQQQGRHDHDPNYRSWRDRQMEALDREYDDYRREHQSRFDTDYGTWRTGRQGQREQLNKVQEHAEVIGSDGQHIGTVDHVRGDRLLLTKSDQAAGGRHHSIPSSWIQSVEDNKVTVGKTADQAKQHWRDEERNDDGGLFGRDRDQGSTNLNRSFSGTY